MHTVWSYFDFSWFCSQFLWGGGGLIYLYSLLFLYSHDHLNACEVLTLKGVGNKSQQTTPKRESYAQIVH